MAVLSSWGQWNVWNNDTVNSVWSGINGTPGNESITLAARPMGGWAVLDTKEGFDTVAITFLGLNGNQDSASPLFHLVETATDWTLHAVNVERFIAADDVIADTNPWSHVDLYLTAGVNDFSTDGSIRSIYGTGGSQNISWDSGVLKNLYATNYNGGRYTTFASSQDSNNTLSGLQPLVMADHNNSAAQSANDIQRGGQRDFEENFIIVDLGAGQDSVELNGHSLTVDNRHWVNTFLWWGYYSYDQYVVPEWTMYYANWDGAQYLHAYNNFKDYTIQFRNVETVTVSYAPTLGPGSNGSWNNPGVYTPVDPRSVYTPPGVDPTDAGFGNPMYQPNGGGTPPAGPYSPGYTPPSTDPTDPNGGFGDPWATDPIPYDPTTGVTPGGTPAPGVLADPVVALPRSMSAATSALDAGYVVGISAPTDNAQTRYFLREIDNNPGVDMDLIANGDQDRIRLSGDNNASSSSDGRVALSGAGFKQINITAQAAVTTAQVQYQVFTDAGLSNEIVIIGTNNSDTISSVASISEVGIYGFGGNDIIYGGTANEVILGGDGSDHIYGNDGGDYIDGEAGDDTIRGEGGVDTLLGGAGADTIYAETDSLGDVINAGAGADIVWAGANDTVDGGAGDDVLYAAPSSSSGRTYFTDNEGNNTITTNGGDSVYFGAPAASGQPDAVGLNTVPRANYVNTVLNVPSETVTMMIEYGATSRSMALENANSANSSSNQTVSATSYFVSDASRWSIDLRSVANANFDVVNVFGGDTFDVGYWDSTIRFIWTFFRHRNTYTIEGQDDDGSIYTSGAGAPFNSLSTRALLQDWLSDGERYYGRPDGAFAPWDSDVWRGWSAGETEVYTFNVASGWSGYLNFYLAARDTTYVWYARDENSNSFVDISSSVEMNYIGSIRGRAGDSLQYASLLDGGISESGTPTVFINPPMPVILQLDPADDTGESTSDGLTLNVSNLTLTGFVDTAISGGKLYRWYDAIDLNGDGDTDDSHTSLTGINESAANADFDLDGTIENLVTVQNVTHVTEAMYGIDFDRDGFLETDLRPVSSVGESDAARTQTFEWIDANANGRYDLNEFGVYNASVTRVIDVGVSGVTDAGDTVIINNEVKLVLGSVAVALTQERDANNNVTLQGSAIRIDLADKASNNFHRYVFEQSTGSGASIVYSPVSSDTAATVRIDIINPGLTLAVSGGANTLTGTVNETSSVSLFVADNAVAVDDGTDPDLLERGSVTVNPGAANGSHSFNLQPRAIVYDAWMQAEDRAGNIASTENSQRIVFGTNSANTITASNISSFVYGFDGDDFITGGSGNDSIFADSTVSGTPETFTVTLQSGNTENATTLTFDNVTFDGEIVNINDSTDVDAVGNAVATQFASSAKWTVTYNSANDRLTFTQRASTESAIPDVGAFNFTDPSDVVAAVQTTQQGVTGSAGLSNDTIVASGGADTVDGGGGTDTFEMTGSISGHLNLNTATAQTMGSGSVVISNIENIDAQAATTGLTLTGLATAASEITGGSGNDTITGGSGNDYIGGGAGADVINAGGGLDNILGAGQGADAITHNTAGSLAITVTGTDAVTLTASVVGAAAISLTGVNTTVNASTSSAAVSLTGNTGNDSLTGGSDSDTISGGTGADTITGGAGADSLVGGDGNDVLRFASGSELAADTTVLGGANDDTIEITAADLTIVDANFTKVDSVVTLVLSGASSAVLGSSATAAGIATVRTGAGATSVTRTDATSITVDANLLANNTLLTIDDSGVTANFTVNNLVGNLNAGSLAGNLVVDLNNNNNDNTIEINISGANATIAGGAAGDAINITQIDSPTVVGIQTIDLTGNSSNVAISTGGGRQTIMAGVGIYSIETGAGDANGMDRIEFLQAGSAALPGDLTANDATLISQISSISNYNLDVIDFVGTDAIAANVTAGVFATDGNGVVTAFGASVTDLGDKIAAVRNAMDQWGGITAGQNRIVLFTHQDGARTDTYAYGSGSSSAGDDQIVRIVDDSLNQITIGSSFVLDVAPPVSALVTTTSLLPTTTTWWNPSSTSSITGSFTPGNDGNSGTDPGAGGDGVNGTTNNLIRDSNGTFGAMQGAGDDYFTTITVPNTLWSTGLNMFGNVYTQLMMGSNGYVTFGTGFRGYVPSGIDGFTRSPMLAAQFDDLYTGQLLRNVAHGAGSGTSLGSTLMYFYSDNNKLVFTWDNVGLYSSASATTAAGRGSAFQIILHKPNGDAVASQNFGIEYRYEEVTLQSSNATAGWTAGDRANFFLINPTKTDLHHRALDTNVGINGVWGWEVRGGNVTAGTYLPDVGLTAAAATNVINVRGFTATSYTLSGEAASQFTVAPNATPNSATVSTIANATFNLWKDQYADGVATYTITPMNGGTSGTPETIDLSIVRNTDSDGQANGVFDRALRTAGSNTITVDAGGSLVDDSDADLGGSVAGFTTITTITATGSGSTINISHQSESYTLNGNSGVDSITGGSGSDTITGGADADSLLGGAGTGDDIFIIASTADHAAGEVITGGSHVSGDQIRLTSTTPGTLFLLSTVTGVEQVRIAAADGTAAGTSAVGINAAAIVGEIALHGNAGNNELVGNGAANTILGGLGDDTITGGAGSDSMNGEGGNDIFIISAATDHAAGEVLDGGVHSIGDQIRFTSTSGGTLVLLSTVTGIEEIRISAADATETGTSAESVDATAIIGAINLRGNAGNNQLIGNASANTIIGGSGNDTMIGDAGNDSLLGGLGDDSLSGGTGADSLEGGIGDDIYVFTASADAGDIITEAQILGSADVLYVNGAALNMSALGTIAGANGAGVDIIRIKSTENATFAATQLAGSSLIINEDANSGNTTLNITGATGPQSFASLAFTAAGSGNAFDDGGDSVVINIANGGTNVITGTSIGDTFVAGIQFGSLSINGGGGTDELRATGNLILTGLTSVENLTFLIDGTEVLVSASAFAGSGLTSVTGTASGAMIEHLTVNAGNTGETINVSSVTFTDAAARLNGGTGTDSLTGGSGNDYIDGGTGADTLTGGFGIDVFSFAGGTSGSATGSDIINFDVITDFTAGWGGDQLAQSGITASYSALSSSDLADVAAEANLQAAADLALTRAAVAQDWTAFDWGSNTYAVHDQSGDGIFDNSNSILVQLTGVNVGNLVSANFA